MRKYAIVMVTCAFFAGCAVQHRAPTPDDGVLGPEIDTGIGLAGGDPYALSFTAVVSPEPHDASTLLLAWTELRFSTGQRFVHLAELSLEDGAHTLVATYAAEGNESIQPGLTLVGPPGAQRAVLSWDEGYDRVRIVIDPTGDAIETTIATPERRSSHSLAGTEGSIYVAWAGVQDGMASPMLTMVAGDGSVRSERMVGVAPTETGIDYGYYGHTVATSTDGASRGIVAWTRHASGRRTAEVVAIDETGYAPSSVRAIGVGADVMAIHTSAEGDASSALFAIESFGMEGLETRFARVSLDGSDEAIIGPTLAADIGSFTALHGTAAAAAVWAEDEYDSDFMGCGPPRVVRSDLWLVLVDRGSLGPTRTVEVGRDVDADMMDGWSSGSLLRAPTVVAVYDGFAVLWIEGDTLRLRWSDG